MNSLLFDNLLSWSAQVSILAIAAAAASFALRHPRARLYFWQAILAIILLLPAIAPWKHAVTVALPSSASVTLPAESVMIPCPRVHELGRRATAGLAGRRRGAPAAMGSRGTAAAGPHPETRPSLCRIRRSHSDGRARWYMSDQVSGPVTFGWLRPSILLPTTVCELPAERSGSHREP